MEVPREVIFRHAFAEAAKYFADKIEQERRDGRVAVLVKNFNDSLFYLPCDDRGYPRTHYLKVLEMPRLSVFAHTWEIPRTQDITVMETEISIQKPLLSQRYDMDYPIVFMWEGRKMGSERVPVEKLNVSELMRIAQTAIQNREGLVIDEALKNKIYK